MPPRGAPAPASIPSPTGRNPLRWLGRVLVLVAMPLLVLVVATLVAIGLVRLVGDLRLGIDPFLPAAQRPRLTLAEVSARGVVTDALRQVLMAAMVVAAAVLADRAGWRARLGLARPAIARAPMGRLWLLLPLWPVLHITWVTTTAAALHVNFGHGVRISPFLSAEMVALWFAFVVLLAPVAEELLLRGEAFARASAFLGPAGTIAATALLFCLAHVSLEPGTGNALARPLTLLPLALTLGWLRWRSGRLWPCILLHGWSNAALLAYQLSPGLR